MKLSTAVNVNASKEKLWEVIADIENCADYIEGIDKVEVEEAGDENLVGLKWKETRTMFGKSAAITMWVTEGKAPEYYRVVSEANGALYDSEMRITALNDGCKLSMSFQGKPQTFSAKVMTFLMGWMMKGATKKSLTKDLEDIKKKAENG